MNLRTISRIAVLFRMSFSDVLCDHLGLTRFALFVTISCFVFREIEACQLSVETCDCEVKSIKRLQEHTYLLTGIREEGTCFMLVSHGERLGYWNGFDYAGYNEQDGLMFLNRNGSLAQLPLIALSNGGLRIGPEQAEGGEVDLYRLFLPTPVPRDRLLEITFAEYLPSSNNWILAVDARTEERWFRYSTGTNEVNELELQSEENEFLDFFDFVYRGEHPFVRILDTEPQKLLLCHEFLSQYRCMKFSVQANALSDAETRDLGDVLQVVFNKDLTGGFLIPNKGGNFAPIVRWYFNGQEDEKVGEIDIRNFREISKFRENSRLALQNEWLVWIEDGESGDLRIRNLPTGKVTAWSFHGTRICTVAPVINSENEVFFVDSNGVVSLVDCSNGQVVSTFSGISPE